MAPFQHPTALSSNDSALLDNLFHPRPPMENNEEETTPVEYLNNENPFAFCREYHKNAISRPERKTKLAALQRIQPHKISFRMPQRFLEKERQTLIDAAAAEQRARLIQRGLAILGVPYAEDPEALLEQNIHIEEIMDIALAIKKYKLAHHQRRLRSKVSVALSKKLTEREEYGGMSTKGYMEIDNLKDALVYCKLDDLYNKKE